MYSFSYIVLHQTIDNRNIASVKIRLFGEAVFNK